MGKINLSIFDTFAYLLPGLSTLLAAAVLLGEGIDRVADAIEVAKTLDVASGLAFVIAAYVLGFGIDSLGDALHKHVGFRIWGEPYAYVPAGILGGRALVREYAPENYAYIQTWKVMSSMAQNLSVATTLLALAAIIRTVLDPNFDWAFLSGSCIIFAFIFFHRAHVFDRMHYRDLAVAVEVLHLEGRVPEDKGEQASISRVDKDDLG